MKPGRMLVFAAMVASCSGVACTAIILAKLGDAKDFPEEDGSFNSSSSSSSSSSGAPVDECSLLLDSFDKLRPPNRCASCIDRECGSLADFACKTEGADWFGTMKRCAQEPWDGFVDLDGGATINGNWGCANLEKDSGLVSGQSLGAEKNKAENCIRDNCIFNSARDCRLCDVWTTTKVQGEERKLSEDKCGKCLTRCPNDLADCCSSDAVKYYGQACADTGDEEKRNRCYELDALEDKPDAAGMPFGFDARDRDCALRLRRCFKANCTTNCTQ